MSVASPPSTIVSSPVEIASLQSPSFSLIAVHTLKPSQNQYTEIILRTLGKLSGADGNKSNEDAGLEAVRKFLHEAGVGDSDLVLSDGSGLSRNDMINANATVQLLTFMSKHRYFAQFRDALPIAGVDGTLRTRMKGTPAGRQRAGEDGFVKFGCVSVGLCDHRCRRAPGFFHDAEQLPRRQCPAPVIRLTR